MSRDEASSAYQRSRAEGDAALRADLLDVAGGLLVREGASALTMRRVAEAAGCSTTVLYRLFAGKHGLVRGLYREGFARLQARLEALPTAEDALVHLRAVGRAYRDQAVAEPAYYAVMFSRPVPEFTPSADDVAHARRSLQVLTDAVAAAQRAGELEGPAPGHVAEVLWAAAHGAVSLEFAGHLAGDDAERVYAALTAAAVSAFRPAGPRRSAG